MTITLAPPAPAVSLRTRSGLSLDVRPVQPGDAPALAALFASLSPEDLRFRFLSAVRTLSPAQLDAMLAVDHQHSEHLLAFDADGTLVASAMVAAGDRDDTAEIAIAVAGDRRNLGIGWALLRHAVDVARDHGFRRVQTIESVANHAAIEVERDMGFTAHAFPGDASLLVLESVL